MPIELSIKLPAKHEGLADRNALFVSLVAERVLKESTKRNQKKSDIKLKAPESFSALAKLESLAGEALFNRNWPLLSEADIKKSFKNVKSSLGRMCPISQKEWLSFFRNISEVDPESFNREYSVALIIPVYKPKKYLKQFIGLMPKLCIYFSQIILVDDASPREEFEQLESAIKNFKKVELCKLNDNSGPGAARNFGLSKVKSDWVTFMDFDDAYDFELLPYVLKCVTSSNDIQAFTNNLIKMPSKKYFLSQLLSFPDLAYQNQVAVNLWLKKDLLKTLNFKLYNETLKGHFEDWGANLKLRFMGIKPVVIPLSAYIYNVHNQSRQSSPVETHWQSRKKLLNLFDVDLLNKNSKYQLRIAKLLALKIQKLSQEHNLRLRSRLKSRVAGILGL